MDAFFRRAQGEKKMTRLRLFRLENGMIFSNLVANMIGVCVVMFLTQDFFSSFPPQISLLGDQIDCLFIPSAIVFGMGAGLIYEIPIRRFLYLRYRQVSEEGTLRQRACRWLLNEPFFLIAVDLFIWFVAAFIYPLVFWLHHADAYILEHAFFVSIYTGLITTTVAFFVFEFVLQRRIIPYFFPQGGIYQMPGTIRITIRTRLFALLFACNLVPFASLLNAAYGSHISGMENPEQALETLRIAVLAQSLIFMAVGVWITFLVGGNLARPLREIIRVLKNVRHGRFDGSVRVTSNDEVGYTGDVINEMTAGLKERDFIKETFGKYVTTEIRDEILSGNVSLDGERKEVTVLFADLRSFTPLVASTPPKDMVRMLNNYFTEMEKAIHAYHGLILQFIGDEIEAVFGAPLHRSDHPVLAARAALTMRDRLRALNQRLVREGYESLKHGVGIHTGEVLAANIGSPERLSYALVGETVNLASRLQGLTKRFKKDIILSEQTRQYLGDSFSVEELPRTDVKGVAQPVGVFALSPP
jgi:adenylate cyclase